MFVRISLEVCRRRRIQVATYLDLSASTRVLTHSGSQTGGRDLISILIFEVNCMFTSCNETGKVS